MPGDRAPFPCEVAENAARIGPIPSHVFAGKRSIAEAKPVENGSKKVEAVNATSIDMYSDASRLTSRGESRIPPYSNPRVPPGCRRRAS